jgi:hypothetical protein
LIWAGGNIVGKRIATGKWIRAGRARDDPEEKIDL